MKHSLKTMVVLFLLVGVLLSVAQPAAAANVPYLPDVTEEMKDYRFWSNLQDNPDELILTMDEIKAYNQDTIDASGTKVMDLKGYPDTFNGISQNEAIQRSATADAEYYFGWTYDPEGKKAEWSYYQEMIDNCCDPTATEDMPYRYGIAVNRTVLKVFPSDNPIWDDPADVDFDYQSLSAVRVNEPLLIYTTSADGKYYLGRIAGCSGWIAAEDVAICADKEEWLSAWDLPSEDLIVVYGNKIYTETSIYAPDVSRRMLTQGTALEWVKDVDPDEVIINRYPYHNYVVYLPVRREDGSYEKQMALISETAEVSEGYLPLTTENIAMVTLENLGDTYGWGGMLDVEDCSGQVRTVYACFGLSIARNGNWQWNMHMEKVDMSYMSLEEKCMILDELPLGSALGFPGHEMIYLGKYDGKYYVLSAVGSIMSPVTGNRLRVRGVILNTLDIKRANGQTWMQALDQAFMPAYPTLEGKTYDFPKPQWYREGVSYCLKEGLMVGYDDGSFRPQEVSSRSMIATMLWRLEGKPESTDSLSFRDVEEGQWYTEAIRWAKSTGVMEGYSEELFGVNDAVSREQMATILWRYMKYKGEDVSAGENVNILSYSDAFEISTYAVEAMQWACGSEVIKGKIVAGENILDPKGSTTRAELAVMMSRL